MQTGYSGDIARVEWRWVMFVSVTLILLSFSPFLMVALLQTSDVDWRFMGALHGHEEAVAALAMAQQGEQGRWLINLPHTPDLHRSVIIQPVYPLLGHLARLSFLSTTIFFHLIRLAVAVVMYAAVYHLGASIWVKVRSRRIFFVVASIGSGLGWLYALFMNSVDVPDLQLAQGYPFYSALVNIHYPLTIMALCLMSSVLISIFRPGAVSNPAIDNGGVVLIVTSLLLSFLYPQALLPITLAMLACIVAGWLIKRQITVRELNWAIWLIVPTLPVLIYFLLTWMNNDVLLSWATQRAGQPPEVLRLVLSLGLPLLLAIPGLVRALRRFEPDGDRFMLLWLLTIVLVLYGPFAVGVQAFVAIMIPIAYFATRATEDFWFQRFHRRLRRRIFFLVIPALTISYFIILYFPVVRLINGQATATALERGYLPAFEWLSERVQSEDIILASPDTSAWIPVWVGSRVVYGHTTDTAQAQRRRAMVINWYRTDEAGRATCPDLADWKVPLQTFYPIRYIVYGPRERMIGPGACLSGLRFVASFDDVLIYTTAGGILPP